MKDMLSAHHGTNHTGKMVELEYTLFLAGQAVDFAVHEWYLLFPCKECQTDVCWGSAQRCLGFEGLMFVVGSHYQYVHIDGFG
jgi:hypothetical protein